MAIPDEALHDAREASRLFAATPRGSEAEREAAAALAAAFDALDDHLSAGGGLPGDWERLPPATAVSLATDAEHLRQYLSSLPDPEPCWEGGPF